MAVAVLEVVVVVVSSMCYVYCRRPRKQPLCESGSVHTQSISAAGAEMKQTHKRKISDVRESMDNADSNDVTDSEVDND